MLICRILNTRVHLLNQFIKEQERMSYIAPIDETKFWLYEILEAKKLFSLSKFHGLKKDDLNYFIDWGGSLIWMAFDPLNSKIL